MGQPATGGIAAGLYARIRDNRRQTKNFHEKLLLPRSAQKCAKQAPSPTISTHFHLVCRTRVISLRGSRRFFEVFRKERSFAADVIYLNKAQPKIMAPVTFWKGYLKLSLVTCPVAMTPAVSESEKVRFHTLNKKTGHRVQSRYIDAQTHEPVERDNQIKGYEVGADDYVTLEDSDLEAVALESTNTIDLQSFVPKDSIDWIWYDRPHYLLPDDPVGEEAFSVIRDAMTSSGLVAISRLVLYRRERAVMLEPHDRGIVLWTLRLRRRGARSRRLFRRDQRRQARPQAFRVWSRH